MEEKIKVDHEEIYEKRYKIVKKIGEGAQAIVYEVLDIIEFKK